jgi:hypothetical protein
MASKTKSLHFSACFLTFIFILLFTAVPVSAKVEDHIVKTESGFYYTVQKGDTLWDLSKQFKDSPWEWPGLWSNNPQIPNPHLIYPGQKLLIFKKDWQGMEKKEEVLEPMTIPVIEPAAKPLHSKKDYFTFLGIDKVGFILDEEITPVGVISKSMFDYKVLYSTGDLLYVIPSSDANPMAVGDKYVTYRTARIRDRDTAYFKYSGYQYLLTGIVEIVEVKPDYALVKVNEAFRHIEINDYLMPYQPREPEIALKDGVPGLSAKLIRAEEGTIGMKGKNLVAENDIVFFDKGQNDGVEIGQTYPIHHPEKDKFDSKTGQYVQFAPVYIGELLVLHTEATTSTALILNTIRTIEPGQIVGSVEP